MVKKASSLTHCLKKKKRHDPLMEKDITYAVKSLTLDDSRVILAGEQSVQLSSRSN